MSKEYRNRKKRLGIQARHKGRHVHKLDDVMPLSDLRTEIDEHQYTEETDGQTRLEQNAADMLVRCCIPAEGVQPAVLL